MDYIRYMLITLEDYAEWYEEGAQGNPVCKDKTRIFDFSNTTLEHIYPRSPIGGERNEKLEEVKNTIGNLTILDEKINNELANGPFSKKRLALQKSNLKANRDIGAKTEWTAEDVKERTEKLIDMAVKVFVP